MLLTQRKPTSEILNGSVLICLMLVWGGAFIGIKICLRYVSPFELLLVRFIPSTLLFFPLAYAISGRKLPKSGFIRSLSKRTKIALAACALLATPLYNYFLNLGETIIPAGWASIIIALNPASITLFAAVLLKEKITGKRTLGILISFMSLFFIAYFNDVFTADGVKISAWLKIGGVIITLGAVFSWGLYVALSKKLMERHDPMIILAWVFLIGTAVMLPGLRWSLVDKLISAPIDFWISIAYLSIFCTVLGLAAWQWALSKWHASRAGMFIYLVPLSALTHGWWLLGEELNFMIVLGALGVISGVMLAGSKRN